MSKAGLLPRRWRTGRDDAHDAEAIAGILDTPPIAPARNGPTIAAQVGARQVLPFLVAAKSLHRALGRGYVAICDDGTLTGPDRTILAFHCGDPEIFPAGAVPLTGFPPGKGWEPWLAAYDRRRGEYWLLLDPLAIASGPLERINRALQANRSFTAGAALTGFAAGGPGRPDTEAPVQTLGAPDAAPREALAFLMAREAGAETFAINGAEDGEIAHFGSGGAAAHAAASRAAIAALG